MKIPNTMFTKIQIVCFPLISDIFQILKEFILHVFFSFQYQSLTHSVGSQLNPLDPYVFFYFLNYFMFMSIFLYLYLHHMHA